MNDRRSNLSLWWLAAGGLVLVLGLSWWLASPSPGVSRTSETSVGSQKVPASAASSSGAEPSGVLRAKPGEAVNQVNSAADAAAQVAPGPVVMPGPVAAANPAAPSEPVKLAEPRPKPLPPEPTEPAREQTEAIALNIRQYRLRFGGNPVGSNAEIVRELDGANPAQARYLPSELKRLNENGELLDAWDTPYFFHQESADRMEVRSAGADRKLWTSDDIVSY